RRRLDHLTDGRRYGDQGRKGRGMPRMGWPIVAAGLALLGPVPGCAPSRGDDARVDSLTIGAYSVVREAFHLGILPPFAAAWPDLARPVVDVLYSDPKTSGGARWNINAIYGAGLLRPDGTTDPEAARDLLARVQARVVNMDTSGRQSMATFERGTGDAIVT